jgi:hypothetical protein
VAAPTHGEPLRGAPRRRAAGPRRHYLHLSAWFGGISCDLDPSTGQNLRQAYLAAPPRRSCSPPPRRKMSEARERLTTGEAYEACSRLLLSAIRPPSRPPPETARPTSPPRGATGRLAVRARDPARRRRTHERLALPAGVIADRAAQHRISGLKCVQHRSATWPGPGRTAALRRRRAQASADAPAADSGGLAAIATCNQATNASDAGR